MVAAARDTGFALKLASHAASILDAAGDTIGAMRLRHVVAIIRDDARYAPTPDLAVPLSLMHLALALMDRDGLGTTHAALALQAAIDDARGAVAPMPGMMVDRDLIGP